jgi:hypothetical protein
MADFQGPVHLAAREVERRVPGGVPGAFALGHARPQEGAVFISFVGRSDTDLKAAVLSHVGSRYTACFFLPVASAGHAYAEECRLWHEMGGEALDSNGHPVPPGDHPCPVCD